MQIVQVDTTGRITPRPGGQKQFAENWEHFIVSLEGGWYSGKTFIGARKLTSLHIHNGYDEDGQPTFVPSGVCASTLSNAYDYCLPALTEAFNEAGLSYKFKQSGVLGESGLSAPALILPDLGTRRIPSAILIRSADNASRIAGFMIGAGWGDEAARWKNNPLDPLKSPLMQWISRIRHPQAKIRQALFTYTNEGDATGIYDLTHGENPDCALYRANTRDNPTANDYVQRLENLLTVELAKQYIAGEAISLRGGKVYSVFCKELHIDESLRLNPDRPPHLSLDFNISPGMHGEIGQYHGDVDMFTAIYEIHAPRMSVREAALKAVGIFRSLEWDWRKSGPLEVYGDATGNSEWSGTGQSNYDILIETFRRYEIPYRIRVPKANPLVVDRINAVNVALLDVRGNIHYKIHPRCERLKMDFEKMKYDEYGEIDKTDRKLSHPSDGEGYRIHYIRPIRKEQPKPGGQFSV